MTACTTCWFAGDGASRHCGKCACCPESARVAARARRRTYRLQKIRELTPAEIQEMERLIEAEQRDRETEEGEYDLATDLADRGLRACCGQPGETHCR